jgi:hypothetical protein
LATIEDIDKLARELTMFGKPAEGTEPTGGKRPTGSDVFD